jgi:hypothetical protein
VEFSMVGWNGGEALVGKGQAFFDAQKGGLSWGPGYVQLYAPVGEHVGERQLELERERLPGACSEVLMAWMAAGEVVRMAI